MVPCVGSGPCLFEVGERHRTGVDVECADSDFLGQAEGGKYGEDLLRADRAQPLPTI
jgi:hypothetical protein